MRRHISCSLIVLFLVTIMPAQSTTSSPTKPNVPKMREPMPSKADGATSHSEQISQSTTTAPIDPQFGHRRGDQTQTDPELEAERLRLLNKERYNSLKKDTTKLLELAQQLKDQVDKSGEHTLSLEVIKKTDEIERLVKQVRDKMKG